MSWEDSVLLRIDRQFSKDEAVAEIRRRLREKETEIGQLKSEVAHLENELEEIREFKEDMKRYKKRYRESKKAEIKDEIYLNMREQLKNTKSALRKCKIEKQRALSSKAREQINNG